MVGSIVEGLTKKLGDKEPDAQGLRLAAVAMILKGKDDPDVLLIRRADREGDPWSGQVAFPGGKVQEGDENLKETAARETMEEVGIDLGRSAEFLGYSETVRTHTGTMSVVPCAFIMKEETPVHTNQEVASTRWVRVRRLLAPESRSTFRMDYGEGEVNLPAYAVGDYVVWGLTYRIVSSLLSDAEAQ